MKFARLLASGKSMVSGSVSGRYQMRDHVRLPQFISPKNPFAAEATAEESTSQAATLEERGAVVSVVTLKQRIAAVLSRAGEVLKRAALWCLDHNPFSAIGRPQLPSIPRFGKQPVQGELSLDKVKVVRPDLTHADLEVVRNETRPGAAWQSLASRVFGGGTRAN
ncbi:MAG TPA: hypothetical protein VFZ59_07295 [Verrucomicrobiae bacterium]|nr:hypothetical protein [Verrucomicrobiae bacterium]